MTTTAADAAELTEFESMDVELVNGVAEGANGFPHLLMKGLGDAAKDTAPAADNGGDDATWRHDPMTGSHEHPHPAFGAPDGDDCDMHGHVHEHGRSGQPDAVHDHPHPVVKAVVNGKIDQKPDVKLADQILALVGQAMSNESDEVTAGKHDETRDVSLLTRIHQMVQTWRDHEMHPDYGNGMEHAVIDSVWAYPPDEMVKAHREFSADERKKQASEGNSLPDGSYPIPDADALRRAAILARSKHGNWQAAMRLIARRARELGVPNPLDDTDDDGKAGKAMGTEVADSAADADTVQQGSGSADLAKAVADAVTKATKPLQDALARVEADLAKVKATPIPGGPVLSAAALGTKPAQPDAEDHAAKSAYYAQMADKVTDKPTADGYRILARQHAEKAASATP